MNYQRLRMDRFSPNKQTHVHEALGSVKMAGMEVHNHRFALVTGKAIKKEISHVHEVKFNTDFVNGHYHEFIGTTGEAIKTGDRHIHYLNSITTSDDGHRHRFEFATLIDSPTDC